MHEKKSFSTRVDEFLGGKGFYIVLFACIAVIGVSAWLLLFSRFSPLSVGDDGDYVDAMGSLNGQNTPDKNDGSDVPDKPGNTDQPEHQLPEDKPSSGDKDASNSLTVQDTSKDPENDKPKDEPDSKPEEPKNDGEGSAPGAVTSPKDIVFVWPVSGEVTVGHSPDELIYSRTMGDWRTHDGVDIQVRQGTKVLCCANGTVTRVYNDDLFGTTVVIDHGAGVVSTCSNLAGTPTVKEGDCVTMASVIGSVGDTALGETGDTPHLHFSMTVNGDKVDPIKYLPKK